MRRSEAREQRPRMLRRDEIALLFVQGNGLARKVSFLVRGRARLKPEHFGQIEQSIRVIAE